ncbi:protein kinase domain-containing protein, partial [Haematococcus lacustris]
MRGDGDPELATILKLVKSIFQAPAALIALFNDEQVSVIQGDGLFQAGNVAWRDSFCGWTLASHNNQVSQYTARVASVRSTQPASQGT